MSLTHSRYKKQWQRAVDRRTKEKDALEEAYTGE
jgi:hypothetical protein